MTLRTVAVLLCVLFVSGTAVGETTKTWLQSSEEDFLKGEVDGLSVRSDGKLELAPRLEQIAEAPASYFWDIAVAPDGTTYAAAGPEVSVIRITPDGERSTFFETDAIEIHALALGPDGALYAAAAPEALIYRIGADGESSEFYDPHAPYVWDMAFGPDGALYVATGDRGEVHRVTPDGDGSIYFETGEVHVRSLAFDVEGRLVIGTDPGGLILRVEADGDERRGFVLHQTPKKEVTAIAVGADGSIYASGVGARAATPAAPRTAQPAQQPNGGGQQNGADTSTSANQAAQAARQAPSAIALRVRGGSVVTRISPSGEPVDVWESSDAIVYALGFDPEGRLLVGSGDRGRVYRLDSPHASRLLASLDSNQATVIAQDSSGGVILGASNIGKIYRLGPELAEEGSFESEVLDAKIFSTWGSVEWDGDRSSGAIGLELRSGNLARPMQNWSDWTPSGAEAPAARYSQLRATLRVGDDGSSPVLEAARLHYRPVNRSPRITHLEVTPPNYRFAQSRAQTRSASISLAPLGTPQRRSVQPAQLNQTLVPADGWLAVRWKTEDSNDDDLRASVEIRGEAEANWVLLDEDIDSSEYNWNGAALPDGRYRVRVTVSDSESNPHGDALSDSRESESFIVDNTAPQVSDLAASLQDGVIRASFRAVDAASRLTRAEYSINGGDWIAADPTTRVFDSLELAFDLEIPTTEGGGIALAVRVYDELDNLGAARIIVR